MLKQGLVQIYTGKGKGKTTAAVGLAVRASGHGNRVLFYQFLKPSSLDLGERKSLAQVEGIACRVLDRPWDMRKSFKDVNAVSGVRQGIKEAFAYLSKAAVERKFDVIILDEIAFCVSNGLADLQDVKALIESRDASVEIVMTGRGASKELIALADLVTEMKPIKHPFDNGIQARKGIEY